MINAEPETKATRSLADLARSMRDIDFALLSTRTEGGAIAARPMSNNRAVEYDGSSYYFTWENSRLVADIERDPNVGIGFQGKSSLLGKPGIFVHVEGAAEIVHNRAAFVENWNKDIDRWFEQGVDTPGLAMIHVAAARIHYWDGDDDGEIVV